MTHWLRGLARPVFSAGSILCLHSVVTAEHTSDDPLHVDLSALEKLVHGVQRVAEIVPLTYLVDRYHAGLSTAGLVALTFDDAYHALRTAVEEIFAPKGVPLTVFAVSSALATGESYWWDRIFSVSAAATTEQWRRFRREIGLDARETFEGSAPRFAEIRNFILAKRRGRLDAAGADAVTSMETELGTYCHQRSMTMAELKRVAEFDVVQVGVHTATHPVLPLLSNDEVVGEIQDCFSALREEIPETVPILAVPYGLFDERTHGLSLSSGMDACLTLTGHSLRGQSEHGIPRVSIDRRTSIPRLILRMSTPAEALKQLAGHRPDEFPEIPLIP